MPTEVELALAARDYPRAARHLQQALDALPPELLHERGLLLVRLADAEQRAGRQTAAWAACREAAAIARVSRDGALLADALFAAPAGGAGAWDVAAEHHELGHEALALLDPSDVERRDRLRAIVSSTVEVWSGARPEPSAGGATTAEGRFAELRATHESLLHVRYAEQRLALADRAEALGGDERLAQAEIWRAAAFVQLGRRLDLDSAVMRFGHVVRRLREPGWEWRLTTAQASLALLDADHGRAADLAARALVAAGDHPGPEVGYTDLILRSLIAMRTGEGLAPIERELAGVLRRAPLFAQGWRAIVLLAAGEHDEARGIWRVLAPHLRDLPEAPIEWLIAVNSFVHLALAADDRPSARYLYDLLRPLDGRFIAADALTPSSGPVSLQLGRLAVLIGDRRAARAHLVDAVREADGMHDRYHAAFARAVLRGMRDDPAPLSPREMEVAGRLAHGDSNRAIADRLHLSERTVENHVSHILGKLGLASRAGIAAWTVRRDAAGT